MKYPYALQLYSVRDKFQEDVGRALEAVKAAGFDCVELAGTYGLSPEALNARLERAGLKAVSMHVGYAELVADPAAAADAADIFGLTEAVVPWLGGDTCADRSEWVAAARAMDAVGAKLRERGVRLSYHNHDHEFAQMDGATIFDLIYANSAPEHLALQLDTCWSTVGGADTPALLARYAGRVAQIHVKDCKPFESGTKPVLTELGRGTMDWSRVLPAAKAAGASWYIVEQDESETDSMESAAVNAAFMAACNQE
jgi:sugar phosphate isomerase/epimerase